MTEDEAKMKWCPFARGSLCMEQKEGDASFAVPMGQTGYNRGLTFEAETGKLLDTTMPVSCFCIGSACMAWRWRRFSGNDSIGPDTWVDPYGNAAVGQKGDLKPIGYCGLAGAPQ